MRYALPICLLILAGCASQKPMTAADDPSLQCLLSMREAPQYQPLYQKIGKGSEASIEQLANKDLASDVEKGLIASWASDRAACVDAGREFRSAYAPPGYSMVFQHQQAALIRLAARLYAAEISFGQFNQERQKISAESELAMDRLRRERMAEIDRQNQNDLLNQQLMVDQMRRAFRPIPGAGTGMNCTSRNIGGTIYTDCR